MDYCICLGERFLSIHHSWDCIVPDDYHCDPICLLAVVSDFRKILANDKEIYEESVVVKI